MFAKKEPKKKSSSSQLIDEDCRDFVCMLHKRMEEIEKEFEKKIEKVNEFEERIEKRRNKQEYCANPCIYWWFYFF